MTQWFYADDARNRVGPHSDEELRAHYRQRRLRRDRLVWRDGLPQWQALELVAEELELDAVTPDATLPPPLPAAGATPVYPPVRTAPAEEAGHVRLPDRGAGAARALAIPTDRHPCCDRAACLQRLHRAAREDHRK